MGNNLIAIHGRAGHGKDVSAKIIQILTMFPQMPTDKVVKEIVKNKEFANTDYEIKKFADKLKDIVCLLIGCSRKDLECRDFKEAPLPEEWWVWEVESQFGKYIFTTEREAVESHGGYYKPKLIKTTPRLLCQSIGTNCFRDIIHPATWVLSLFSDYKEHSNWIISDMRFPNEFEAVKKRGGLCVKIIRNIEIPKDEHYSEKALDDEDRWDYIIENNGTLEDLVENIRKFVREAL